MESWNDDINQKVNSLSVRVSSKLAWTATMCFSWLDKNARVNKDNAKSKEAIVQSIMANWPVLDAGFLFKD